jgi:glyoxylate reductase
MRVADVLVPTITDRIDAHLIAQAGENMKLIANFGNGVDNIDVASALGRSITVTNTPGVLTEDTADMTMALILSVARRLVEGARAIPEGSWAGWSPTWMLGHRITGKRLGIVGMGRIGQAVASRARAFGMLIHYHNRKPVPEPIAAELDAFYWPDLDAMVAEMDMVVLTCPRTSETYHLFSAERLARMKPTAYLINTARGDIVDEAALAAALKAGRLAGAGLDVFEHEPKINPALLTLPNVVLLPHMGSGTVEARNAMGMKVVANMEAFLEGRELPDRAV